MRKQLITIFGSTFRLSSDGSKMTHGKDENILDTLKSFLSSRGLDEQFSLDNWEVQFIDESTGAHATHDLILKIMQIHEQTDDLIAVIGTDCMEEISFGLSLLDLNLENKNIVLTGAMRPADHLAFDGLSNLLDAMIYCKGQNKGLEHSYYSNQCEPNKVAVSIQNTVFDGSRLFKSNSSSMQGFEQIKERYNLPKFNPLLLKGAFPNIPIITTALGLKPDFINFETLDGLVIAGMGTSSLNQEWIDYLRPKSRDIPIALVSKCPFGNNYDDLSYINSIQKYEDLGFHLNRFRNLNPLQARLLLGYEYLDRQNR